MNDIEPAVGLYAYARPRNSRCRGQVHRGVIEHVEAGKPADCTLVTVVFDDVPEGVDVREHFYTDELISVTRPHARAS